MSDLPLEIRLSLAREIRKIARPEFIAITPPARHMQVAQLEDVVRLDDLYALLGVQEHDGRGEIEGRPKAGELGL